MHLNSWELTEFQSISFCNTYGLHLIKAEDHKNVLVLDINGIAHWKDQNLIVNLKEHLEEERNYADFDIELVASDSYLASDLKGKTIYLATCWIVYDQLFAPERHFAALFTVVSNKTKLVAKFDLNYIPTYTRLTENPPIDVDDQNKKLYWLVFAYSGGNCAYSIEDGKTTQIDRIGDFFPFLDIQDLPGSAIRSYCVIVGQHRFSFVGYDTGYVIASVCLMHSGIIIDRKSLKFDGPISILKVLQTETEICKISILISSTIGPATVWELRLQDENIYWEHTHILLESELYDSIIAGAVHKNLLFIGTYGELLLVYDSRELLFRNEISPIHTVNVASPILSIAPIDEKILVLSKKGLHKFKPLFSSDHFEPNLQPKMSIRADESISVSPSNNSNQI